MYMTAKEKRKKKFMWFLDMEFLGAGIFFWIQTTTFIIIIIIIM